MGKESWTCKQCELVSISKVFKITQNRNEKILQRQADQLAKFVTSLTVKKTTQFSTPTYLKEQAEAHPLVVPVQLLVLLILGRLHTWVGHVHTDPLPEGTFHRVRGMNPAVSVEHVLWYIFRVNTIDGVADVLARGHDQAERDQHHNCERVMEAKHGRIYVDVADLYEILEAAENVQHRSTVSLASGRPRTSPRCNFSALVRSLASRTTTVPQVRIITWTDVFPSFPSAGGIFPASPLPRTRPDGPSCHRRPSREKFGALPDQGTVMLFSHVRGYFWCPASVPTPILILTGRPCARDVAVAVIWSPLRPRCTKFKTDQDQCSGWSPRRLIPFVSNFHLRNVGISAFYSSSTTRDYF